ncbi:hypothetical protein JTB14_034782 [Gonioctena quinquepunctata]|nr:hypothetical protein JTB14_034782 [Gonioctena quinquepunctata]
MYTNPFSRTHSHVRQVIDRFLFIVNEKKNSKNGLKRNSSVKSSCSTSSSLTNEPTCAILDQVLILWITNFELKLVSAITWPTRWIGWSIMHE